MNMLYSLVMSSGLLFSTSVSALINSDDTLFQACVRGKGPTYIIAISNYFSSVGGTNKLVELAGDSSVPTETRLEAHIILARSESSKSFDEFTEYFHYCPVKKPGK